MYNKNQQSVIFSCSHISKSFGMINILKDISFTISKNEKVGLVGPNGSGKSTLLKIIANLLEKDSGMISYSKETKIKYLPQIHLEEEKMSGGEIAKKILIPIISSDADLFILDEPTNNLDNDGLNMLENFIMKSSKSFLIVSHDRTFLDKIVTKIIEIDSVTKDSSIYNGNYSNYIEERERKVENQWKIYNDKIEKTEKLKTDLKNKLSWIKEIEKIRHSNSKIPKDKRKDKPTNADLRDREGRAGRRSKVAKNRFERFLSDNEEIEKPKHFLPLEIYFDNEEGSTKVFSIKEIQKTIGKKIIGPIDFTINYGDRIHIIGKNGSGKTTLIKMIVGEIEYDSGLIEKGENVKIGYISQERWFNRTSKTVLEEFLEITKLDESNARRILNRFRITSEDIGKNISLISPGEYSRLVIAELLAIKPNCIILDEPSNHLDLEVMEELENALIDYKGTLIVVSHDRYFVNKIKLNKIFNIDLISNKIK